MSEQKRCDTCGSTTPFNDCCVISEDLLCARLLAYKNAKLPQSWQQKCRQFDDAHITTNADIQAAMQEQIDALNSYAARLACDLLMLRGMIQRAAKEADGYIGAVHNAEKGAS